MSDIQSAAQWIGKLLLEEAKYLSTVEDKVKELQDELEWMQCFLRAADASQFDSAMARKWVAQIREFAYEAEDTIERFLVRVVVPCRSGRAELLSRVEKYLRVVWQFRAVHQTGSEIDALKEKISALSSKLHTYGIKVKMEDSLSFEPSNQKHMTYYRFKEEKIIGRHCDAHKLVSWLVNSESSSVIAICGEGGVGKTFLAEKIFDDPKIRRHFSSFAWANVSKPCQIASVQQELLSSLTSKSIEHIAQMTDDELVDGLYKALWKRNLIVLDDIWSIEVWEGLKAAFPITKQGFASKFLLTTRTDEVARYVYEKVQIHTLGPLTEDQSKLLLREKVGSGLVDISRRERRLKVKLMENMLKHCYGLPLLIVVLAGVLATKKSLEEWKIVDQNLESYLVDPEQHGRRILELSYYDLPYQLKSCLLYLGYFPTNLKIPTRKVTLLWEAEGLVPSTGDDETVDAPQDIAERCLAELMERSLVQVGSRGLTEKVKTCQLHDIIQKLCWIKASKVNWLNIVQLGEESNEKDSSGTSSSSNSSKAVKSSRSAKRRFRRLAIYCSEKEHLEKLPADYRHAKYVRSLLFFNTLKGDDILIPLKKKALRKAFTNFTLLRVLDIENIRVMRLPQAVGFLIHLRYLSVKGSMVSKLPSTMKNLKCLQTLDLRVLSYVCPRIPDVLHELHRLIHLYLPRKKFDLLHHAEKLQLKDLDHLETLSNFSSKCKAKDLTSLINLRKFTLSDFLSETQSLMDILKSPSFNSGQLAHIVLRLDGKILREQGNILESCTRLHKLWVKGEVARGVDSVKLPEGLIQLTFHGSKFQEDPMRVLGELPNLKKLSLEHCSYVGANMRCSRGGFNKLSYLSLHGLEGLEDWQVEEGAMPMLRHLEISWCQKLNRIPKGLSFVKSLKELAISYMPLSFFRNGVRDPNNDLEKWPDFKRVRHVPRIRIAHVTDMPQMQN